MLSPSCDLRAASAFRSRASSSGRSGLKRKRASGRFREFLHKLSKRLDLASSSHFGTLRRGAGEMMGGLAQALDARDDLIDVGLSLVQLKRALCGAAYV